VTASRAEKINELFGDRKRYRIINRERLIKCMSIESFEEFEKWHRLILEEKLKNRELRKEAYWSQSIALGYSEWLASIALKSGLKRYKIKEENPYISYLMGEKSS